MAPASAPPEAAAGSAGPLEASADRAPAHKASPDIAPAAGALTTAADPAQGQGPPAPASRATTPAQRLAQLAAETGLSLLPAQCAALLAYAQLLRRWNRVHNLTAVDTDREILSHHLLDSLAIVAPLEQALARHGAGPPEGRPLHFLDAGSGGGLPGIPLAVARPKWRGTLVDAVEKKCAFLLQAQVELGLGNLTVRHTRLENAGVAPHDIVVSRAFASLADFTRLTHALLKPGGLWIAMKGRHPDAELAALPAAVEILETSTLRVPLLDEERHLVVLRQRADAGPGHD